MPDQTPQIDEEEKQRVQTVKDFFVQLKKGIKTIGLYRHNTGQYTGYLEPAYTALAQALEKSENIGLSVEQMSLSFHGIPVYEEEAGEQNLAFKFYRDGVRLLVFRKDLSSQELLDFVLVCLTHVQVDEAVPEDMVSLLWKQDFKNIEYVVIESFALGSEGTDQTKLEVDKIVSYLYGRLTSQSADSHQFARLSLDDLELEIEDVKQVAGVNIAGQTTGQAEKDAIQAEILSYDRTQLLVRFSAILTDIFSGEIDEPTQGAISLTAKHATTEIHLVSGFAGTSWARTGLLWIYLTSSRIYLWLSQNTVAGRSAMVVPMRLNFLFSQLAQPVLTDFINAPSAPRSSAQQEDSRLPAVCGAVSHTHSASGDELNCGDRLYKLARARLNVDNEKRSESERMGEVCPEYCT